MPGADKGCVFVDEQRAADHGAERVVADAEPELDARHPAHCPAGIAGGRRRQPVEFGNPNAFGVFAVQLHGSAADVAARERISEAGELCRCDWGLDIAGFERAG